MKNLLTPRFIFVISVVFVAAFSRLLPHFPNVTPVAAIALFGGTYINRKYLAFLLPLLALFISDFFLGFYPEMYAVYISFAVTVSLGMLLSKKTSAVSTVVASITSSIIFFVLTNFAVWSSARFAYPTTVAGLALCYEAALPFFRSELFGTLAYNTLFFGALYLAKNKFPILAKA
ncbi:MAG: hypothetical protein HXX18_09405 [Bacteroidetes bacterium]|nr:hypothetical protein [Bacteroidota bacterium]